MQTSPRVHFVYSEIYDQHYRTVFESAKIPESYPSPQQVEDFMLRMEQEWRLHEQEVFEAIAQVTGLAWHLIMHTCYVVGSASPISDPLTMPVFKPQAPIDYTADVLTHELIHRNLIQPEHAEKVLNILTQLRAEFPGENENVIIHILVHAIHDTVFRKVFTEARLLREKKIMSAIVDYRRAWELVDQVGAAVIVQKAFGV